MLSPAEGRLDTSFQAGGVCARGKPEDAREVTEKCEPPAPSLGESEGAAAPPPSPRTAFCQGLSPSRAALNGDVPVPLGSPIGDAPAAFS